MLRLLTAAAGTKGGRRWLPVPYTKDKAEKDFALIRMEVLARPKRAGLDPQVEAAAHPALELAAALSGDAIQ